jgi:hypothetical protein
MPVDNEQIKKALDHFENDEFVDAKEILQKEIRKSKNDHLKNKLELKQDIEPQEDQEKEDQEKEDQEKEE